MHGRCRAYDDRAYYNDTKKLQTGIKEEAKKEEEGQLTLDSYFIDAARSQKVRKSLVDISK
jgi:ribonuclease I